MGYTERVSRYDKPTPPDRPAVRYEDDTPTNPYSQSVPLRAPTYYKPVARVVPPPELEPYVSREEFQALKGEVSRLACDQQSLQSVQLAELRTRRKRISDRIRASVTPQRAGQAVIVAAVMALPALLERFGYGGLADFLRQLGGEQ